MTEELRKRLKALYLVVDEAVAADIENTLDQAWRDAIEEGVLKAESHQRLFKEGTDGWCASASIASCLRAMIDKKERSDD